MPVTIVRTPWIDDDGTGTTGTVINNAEKTLLYNQIDAALAQVMPLTGNSTINGALTVNGTASFIGNVPASYSVRVQNTSTAPTAETHFQVFSDVAGTGVELVGYPSTTTGTGAFQPNSGLIVGGGAGGLSIGASAGTGSIRFYSGGWAERMRIHASGGISMFTPNDPGANVFSVSGTLLANSGGTHSFTYSGPGNIILQVNNSGAASNSATAIYLGNNLATTQAVMQMYASTWTAVGGYAFADGCVFVSNGSGGLNLAAGHPSGPIRFFTGGQSERMRIESNGVVLVNTVTYALNGQISVGFDGSNRNGISLQQVSGSTGCYLMAFFNNAQALIGSINQSGTNVAYVTSSDQRLKTDRGRATDLSALRAIVVHDFDWIIDGTRDRGVFAQEAHKTHPRAVTVGTDERTETGDLARPWGTDYSKFVADLIVGFQQHDADLAALRAELDTLKGSH